MTKTSKDRLKGTLIIPLGLTAVLVPFSLLIGWNLFTLLLFWFVLIPGLSMYLPTLVSSNQNHLIETVLGLVIFYSIMVFMIYDHYQTDYFKAMIISFLINLIVVSIWFKSKNLKVQTA
ncbi:hypothetical protein [Roseivirga pacifica]|uniref:hypothetical protein n=1 Tax=Roseivirga pacifica TaxID=1267423 RepID=UPI00227D487A|nr:hypothetical protein [Roseivirga pacifica]